MSDDGKDLILSRNFSHQWFVPCFSLQYPGDQDSFYQLKERLYFSKSPIIAELIELLSKS